MDIRNIFSHCRCHHLLYSQTDLWKYKLDLFYYHKTFKNLSLNWAFWFQPQANNTHCLNIFINQYITRKSYLIPNRKFKIVTLETSPWQHTFLFYWLSWTESTDEMENVAREWDCISLPGCSELCNEAMCVYFPLDTALQQIFSLFQGFFQVSLLPHELSFNPFGPAEELHSHGKSSSARTRRCQCWHQLLPSRCKAQ